MICKGVRSERGIAMVTVLFIGAVLSVVASTAGFVAVQEFQATGDDQTGAQSLAYAEAGVDRLLNKLTDGSVGWGQIAAAGCTVGGVTYPAIEISGNVGDSGGEYDARFTVKDACPTTFPSPQGQEQEFVITSEGSQPAARRVVQQVVRIRPIGLPIGIYAFERVDANGSVTMESMSMITEGVIKRRDDMGFSGTDPYYTLAAFYGPGNSTTTKIPAAAHALGQITYGPNSSLLEHRLPGFEPNCEANRGTTPLLTQQSLWDGSGTAKLESLTTGCSEWSTRPPTAKFDAEALTRVAPQPNLTERDYQGLADAAKANGIYCEPAPANKLRCVKQGVPYSPDINMTLENNNPIFTGLPNNYVAYFDFPTTGDQFGTAKTITWKRSVSPCSNDPDLHRSAVIVVRNGSISMEGGTHVVGALLLPEGQFTNKGSFTLEGTIIAQRLDIRGGATFTMTECWVKNLPGPFLSAVPVSWSEIDR